MSYGLQTSGYLVAHVMGVKEQKKALLPKKGGGSVWGSKHVLVQMRKFFNFFGLKSLRVLPTLTQSKRIPFEGILLPVLHVSMFFDKGLFIVFFVLRYLR